MNASCLSRDGLLSHRTVKEKWIRPLSGENIHAFPLAAVLVVQAEQNGLTVRHRATALLHWFCAPVRTNRDIERAIEGEFIGADGECASVGCDRYGAHAEPVYDRVGKKGRRTGVRKHIHNQNEMPRTLGTGEGIDVRDVSNRVGDGAGP